MENIYLIGIGVILVLVAILGGGVEVRKVKLRQIPRGKPQIAVGVLGALLLCFGGIGWAVDLTKTLLEIKKDLTPKEIHVGTPPEQVDTLIGTVAIPDHANEFSERHNDFTITAGTSPTVEFSGSLDAQGQFRIESVPVYSPHTVSWSVSRPSMFTIWPLDHPPVPPGVALREFRFQPLDDVYGNEQRRMLEAVTTGSFSDADKRLTSLLRLFKRLGVDTVENNDNPKAAPNADQVRRWRFTVHRHLADAASRFRAKLGRSQITEEQVRIERNWRREMINTALMQASPDQSLRDFARAANSWSEYARQVFSRRQQSWPDRTLASREMPSGGEFLERGSYADWLLDDIVLIRDKLMTPQIRKLVEENAKRPGLSGGQRVAIDSFSSLVEQDPDRVSLNRFVNLLGALNQLVLPARLSRS